MNSLLVLDLFSSKKKFSKPVLTSSPLHWLKLPSYLNHYTGQNSDLTRLFIVKIRLRKFLFFVNSAMW